jgi:rhodanese-related sulfurtransferase
MPTFNAISVEKLARLVGTKSAPVIIDVREGANEQLLPASLQRRAVDVADWAKSFPESSAVIACDDGGDLSAGVAAYLRGEGVVAEVLEGGFSEWRSAGLPMVDANKLPRRDSHGRTMWVTRARPKVDRIACPWLIRRFVDPQAVFLFVAPLEVAGVAERFGAAPFDVNGVFWSHRGEQCTFDAMVDELGLGGFEALKRLAVIVRGADTGRPELAPQSAGLVAVSLGLSRMHSDDMAQLEDGMSLYDAFYRWCRDAIEETHDIVSHLPRRATPAR